MGPKLIIQGISQNGSHHIDWLSPCSRSLFLADGIAMVTTLLKGIANIMQKWCRQFVLGDDGYLLFVLFFWTSFLPSSSSFVILHISVFEDLYPAWRNKDTTGSYIMESAGYQPDEESLRLAELHYVAEQSERHARIWDGQATREHLPGCFYVICLF